MSDNDYSERDYLNTVELHAREALRREKEGENLSDAIHEEADGSGWVIYTYRARLALFYSKNEDAIFEYDGLRNVDSMANVYTVAAYFALRQDITEKVEELRKEEPEEVDAE